MLANGLTDHARVRVADDRAPRPALPYLTVKVTAADIPVGETEVRGSLGRVVSVTGGASGDVYTVSVNGDPVTYTRGDTDTDADTAAGLAAAIVAADPTAYAEATDADLVISAITGSLSVGVTDPNLSLSATTVPIERVVGDCFATVSVQGFGAGAEAWLVRAKRRLRSDSVIAQNDRDCVTIRADGAVSNLSEVLDTSIEPRFLLEVEVDYAFAEFGETMIALGTVSISYTGERFGGDPDPLTDTITVEA